MKRHSVSWLASFTAKSSRGKCAPQEDIYQVHAGRVRGIARPLAWLVMIASVCLFFESVYV
jgi:hypothetical protein